MQQKVQKNVYEFFKKQVDISGKHGRMARELWRRDKISEGYFNRLIDLYILAPIVGFRMGRKAELDQTSLANGESAPTIFPEQMIANSETLNYIMQMILMLDYSETMSGREAIRLALRTPKNEEDYKKMQNLFDSYVRGGIEVLYEELIVRRLNPYDAIQDEKVANMLNLMRELPNSD